MNDFYPPLPTGVITDWDRERYDADTTRERSTRLKAMVDPRGPRAYYEAVHPQERETDPYQEKVDHFVLGHLFHEFTLEGKQNWVACPFNRPSKGWRNAVIRNRPKWVLTETQDKQIRAWREAVMANPRARKYFEDGSFSEQVITWTEQVPFRDRFGVLGLREIDCKAALDGLGFSEASILSLKSLAARTSDIRDEWERALRKFHYHFSEAFHYRGWRSLPRFQGRRADVVHIIVPKIDNPTCYVWQLAPEWLEIGDKLVRNALQRLAKCRDDEEFLITEGKSGAAILEAWPDDIAATQDLAVVPEPWDSDKYELEASQR